ncbi:MAG TPA: 4-hydroxy-tetrahydrodipicolinate reductase [Sediminibacterium sp.]|nr:4-hydroxy-tetrahydrodipicolinate reductase [Sediminibacterium sp.]
MKIALIGYGKMGKAIEKIALEKGHEIVLKIDIDNAADLTPENLRQAAVAIEFTSPHSAFGNVMKCLEYGVPVVCGSTGWLQHWDTAVAYCQSQNGTLIYASNYSIGVNLFFALTRQLAHLMQHYPSYEVSLKEIHHTEKKDAPSGTAITLAEQIMAEMPGKKQWVNAPSARPEDLVILSERIDPAPGTHAVKFHSAIDDIEIIHTAHNRMGFAGGAVMAAEFAITKKGIFGMKDVLGL